MTFDRSLQQRFACLLAGAMSLALMTQSCGKTGLTSSAVVAPSLVARVVVTPGSATSQVGLTLHLTATSEDASGNVLTGRTVTWASDPDSVASVDENGLVTCLAPGWATITATCEDRGGLSSVTVTDVPVASVTVSPTSATVTQGATLQLTAALQDSAGNPLTGRAVAWSSSNTALATVSGQGLVTAVAAGSATITATCEGHSGTSDITVTVSDVDQAPVVSAPATAIGTISNPLTVSVTASDPDGTAIDSLTASGLPTGATFTAGPGNTTGTLNWTPTISQAGSYTVTFGAANALSGSTSTVITVSNTAPVASVGVTPDFASVTVGQTAQLTATPRDANANALTGRAVAWSSNNAAIATVSSQGQVAAVAAGSATITATCEGQSGASAVTVTPAAPATTFGHVFIVTEENTNYADVIGNASMPYLNGLAQQYGLATNCYADTHPSIGNYFMLSTGQIITNDDSYSTVVTDDNIVRQLLAAGKTWKSYAEGMPSVGYTDALSGNYARKHNVFALLADVVNNPQQVTNLVPFSQFATDLANNTLPAFSNIVPDLCNDAHDCSLATADTWLSNNIDPLIKSATFQNDGLLIILFDEAGSDDTQGGGKIAWVAVSGKSKRGYQSTTLYQHESTLRLILQALGVTVFPGASSTAPDMNEFFLP